ncbi:MAG TPA: RHS repeat-associated core domain-containing protein, partial [Solirubrobacteraceae bacterium]|nr:RHS repeat-associated core domain-containing protein [Solirubrobacteraceae bacterium]
GAPRTILSSVEYDEHGRRGTIAYGNGVTGRCSYDPDTSRLVRVVATRGGSPLVLQDLTYTYDPVGNVTHVLDGANETIVFAGQVVSPDGDYTYDPIYRLIRATGREHLAQSGTPQPGFDDGPRIVTPLPADTQAMRNYTQVYAHDDVGNLQSIAHTASGGSWTRTYAYDEPHAPPHSNRLTSTTVGSSTERYEYDAHGNVVSMPHLSLMQWDWKDRLQATATRIVGEGIPETTRYRYDAAGVRVRKTVNNAAGRRTAQRLYLGPYEVYREYDAAGAQSLERQCLNVSDGAGRVCLLETTTLDQSSQQAPGTLVRYQLGDRLGSSVLELDESAAIITYEEYHPYGSTAFQAGRSAAEVSLKRYRFIGRERDRETGFDYHGARYYALWLGRWVSADPAGLLDGPARYTYARSNPVGFADPNGRQSTGDSTGATTVPVLTLSFETPPVRTSTSTQLWLFQQPSFGQDVRATRSGRGIGESVRLNQTAMARWWGYTGPVDSGHPADRPFWSLHAGDVVPVVPQPSGDNRSQGATTDRAGAGAARAAGEFARVDGVDLTAPVDPPRERQPPTAPIYTTPEFRLMRDRLLELPDTTGTPSATSTPTPTATTGTTTATPGNPGGASGSTGSAGTAHPPAQLELDFSGSHSSSTPTGSSSGSTQTATPVHGEPGTGGSGQTTGGPGELHPEGSLSAPHVGGGGTGGPMIGPGGPRTAAAGRAIASANPVIPGADEVEQFFNDLAQSANMRGSPIVAGLAEFAAAGTAVVATSAASGAVAGNLTESAAKAMGATDSEAEAEGAMAAILAGALVGGAVAGPTVIGEPVGIVVGALVGLTAYLLTR